ncbi:hypothetical protein [Cohnella sp. JJ-181]|uniref:hypothetical protein n=1 Tax=Cohnella rhizoplanae TaxID=2974897 RepID=UPI0022FFA1A6|nr:hypothetical protein [Cohnella sp. JJ-181]CAI6087175.1 hypothetical protein COHCIP112018_05367 [Cohnella sp. JJ-181]
MARSEKEAPVYQEPAGLAASVDEPVSTPAPQFTRAQLITSERYAAHRDALAALLQDGLLYTAADVEQRLDEFLNKEAK